MVEKVGFLFPGQGAQFVGMGKELAAAFPAAKALYERADALLGFGLSRLCWEGPAEELTRTKNCQPALYVTSMAALACLDSVVPAAAGGLSLGEYTALAASGAFSFEDGLKLVALRGQAMEEAAQAAAGTMASVLGLDLAVLEAVCAQAGAQVANINSPGQIVISGTPASVQAASEQAKEKGAKRVIPLEVAGAFHSRLMEPAALKLREALRRVQVKPLACPVVSNVTGSYFTDPASIPGLLVDQLTKPVRWDACMRTLAGGGVRFFLEFGAGSVLKGLAKKIDPGVEVVPVGAPDQVREAAARFSAGLAA